MTAGSLVADQYTYSTMIKGMKKQTRFLPKEEAYSQMFGWLDALKAQNTAVDCVLYNCIMDVCIAYRDIDTTLQVYEQMLSEKVEPN